MFKLFSSLDLIFVLSLSLLLFRNFNSLFSHFLSKLHVLRHV